MNFSLFRTHNRLANSYDVLGSVCSSTKTTVELSCNFSEKILLSFVAFSVVL